MIGALYRYVLGRALLLPLMAVTGLLVATPAQADNASAPTYSERWIYYPDQMWQEPADRGPMIDTVLAAHNAERQRWRVPPLDWDEGLARDAQAYAETLARRNVLQHADMSGARKPQGENLWMGTRGAFSYQQMMNGFLEERRFYIARALPDISTTGNWADAGHYSQIIWRSTTAVGCAVASNEAFDFLVCRYDPAGNVWGMRADAGTPEPYDAGPKIPATSGRVRAQTVAFLPDN